VDVMRALVGVDRFQVLRMAHDVEHFAAGLGAAPPHAFLSTGFAASQRFRGANRSTLLGR
jgi:hypothetical protein